MRNTYLVCYDICEDKRLRTVFTIGLGSRKATKVKNVPWTRLIPPPIRRRVKATLQNLARSPTAAASILFLPFQAGKKSYLVPKVARPTRGADGSYELPVPPKNLWLGYGWSVEEYLERLTHDLKGAAGTLGALRLAKLCRELEASVRSRSFGEAAAILERMDESFEKLESSLAPYREPTESVTAA